MQTLEPYVPQEFAPMFAGLFLNNWTRIAATAYDRYLKKGRGLLGFDFARISNGTMIIPYFAIAQILQYRDDWATSDDLIHTVIQDVEKYDPEREMVLLFSFPGREEMSKLLLSEALILDLQAQHPLHSLASPKQCHARAMLEGIPL